MAQVPASILQICGTDESVRERWDQAQPLHEMLKESMPEPTESSSDQSLISDLWKEHLAAPFPKGFRAKDVNGIDFIMLDADVAGCVDSFLSRGNLNLYQIAILGLSYRNLSYVMPILNDEGKEYFWRLERLAELILKLVALKNKRNHDSRDEVA